jgi:hypothetical protein
MRTVAKYGVMAYPVPLQTKGASTDEYCPGSDTGDATAIPPRPLKRLRSNGQPSIRAACDPHRRAGYGG